MPLFLWKEPPGCEHRLHYRQQGQGPLLLILPGNTASSACHLGELAHFSQRFSALSLDFLGTGQSDRVAKWADDWWQSGARQVRALLDHLDRESCTIMGTSGGAVVALWAAILYPEHVRAVIADSCVPVFTPEMLAANVIQDRARRTPEQVAFWRHAHGGDWERVVEADTDMIRRFVEQGGDWFGERLAEVRCPVLLTASKQDAALPHVSRQNCHMAEQISEGRLYLHHEGGHPLMWSQPEVFRPIVDHFLQTLS
jgi:pimeloyl-ACP methyl ester carboxylesterase